VTIKRDGTSPTVNVTNVTGGAQYTLGSAPVADCSTSDATSQVATPASVTVTPNDPTGVGSFTATCAGALDNAGNPAAPVSVSYDVVFAFGGFFSPVDNQPTFNRTKAGSAIPVKFSLGGNHGPNIVAAGYPASQQLACNTSAAVDDIEQTTTAGASGLSYDAAAGQYTYTWKTDKAWSGSCRKLIVRLNDGTDHVAMFTFN
jgi:hypothetical protein